MTKQKPFKAIIKDNDKNIIMTSTGETAAKAIKGLREIKVEIKPGQYLELELFENDSLVFNTYGPDVEFAVIDALDMNKKSRSGGGR